MNKSLQHYLRQQFKFDSFSYTPNLNNLIVDMFISDKCNLKCRHCYFGETKTIGRLLTTSEWKNVISLLYSKGIRHFHISGKESSLDNRVVDIVSYIKTLKDTYTGLVSNGTGKLEFYNKIINAGIDYLEFSFDGTEDTHNYIRGKNSYACAMKNLESLSSCHNEIIDISTCLNKNSIDEYFELIEICSTLGIKKFFATPFLNKGNATLINNYSITPTQLSNLIKNSFGYLQNKPEQKIAIRYCVTNEITSSLIENRLFLGQLIIDYLTNKSNLIYNVNGNLIQISLNLFDIKFLRDITITADGEVIPCSDYISERNYLQYSIGNVTKNDIIEILNSREKSISINLKELNDEN